jgi:hypothetical protein
MMRPAALVRLGCLLLACGGACGPDKERGRPVNRVYLSEPDAAGATGMPAGASGSSGEAGAPAVPDPPSPPTVSAMMPVSGPFGTEITILGTDLGSSARSGVSILLGEDEAGVLAPTNKPEIVRWSETEIRFRFPFPFEGRVLIRTPEGEVVAGEFEPTWVAGPALKSSANVLSTASLAPASGVLAAVLDTGPPSMVSFDGSEWTRTDIAGSNNLRADSIRLYVEGTELAAFALSTALAPLIIGLDPADSFAQNPTTLKVTSDYRVAGGPDGATIWYRMGNDWYRMRPAAGSWSMDKGPIADPNPSGAKHAAAATSSGALYVTWGVASGSALDDRGEVHHRFVAPDASAFTTTTAITGSQMDDSISSILMSDRGVGIVTQYCGTDQDPLGVTASGKLCYSALLPMGPKATYVEFNTLRYGFGAGASSMAYCNPGMGTRLLPMVGAGGTTAAKLDAIAGDIVAWPCANVVALDVDPDGTPLLLLEQDGQLYSPRARVK